MRKSWLMLLALPLAVACGGDDSGTSSGTGGGGTGTGTGTGSTGSGANCVGPDSWTLDVSGAQDGSFDGCLLVFGSSGDTRTVTLAKLSGEEPTTMIAFEAADGTTGSVQANLASLELGGDEYVYDPTGNAPGGGITVSLSRNNAADDMEGTFSGSFEHLEGGDTTTPIEVSGSFNLEPLTP